MSTERLPSGKYRITIAAGKRPDGKTRRLRRTMPAQSTRTELAQAELNLRIQAGTTAPEADMLPLANVVAQNIALAETRRARKTTYEYRGLLNRWISPYPLGDTPISRIRTPHLEQHYATIGWHQPGPAPDGKVGVTSVRRTHALISLTLKWATAQGWIATNPATSVTSLPSPTKPAVKAADPNKWHQATQTADQIQPGLRALLLVLGTTGMRRGEAVALTWADIQQTSTTTALLNINKSVSVTGGIHLKPTKTGNTRKVPIRGETIGELTKLRQTQIAACMSSPWVTFSEANHVWSRDGHGQIPWRPDVAGKWIAKTGVRAGELRHMVPTQLLAAGVDVMAVAEIMGHSSPKMTLDVYAEAVPAQVLHAADIMNGLASS